MYPRSMSRTMSYKEKLDVDLLQQELSSAELVFHWSTKLFGLLGINPLKVNNRLYSLVLIYTLLHLIMSCAALPSTMKSNLNVIIDAITELGSLITVFTKLLVYKYQRSKLAGIMREIFDDYSVAKYNSEREVRICVDYGLKAKAFFKFIVSFGAFGPICYYLRSFVIMGIGIPKITDAKTNGTLYLLPYRMRFYYPLVSAELYISAMVYLLPILPITAFTLVSDAAMIIAMLAHLCAQLSVLSRCLLQFMAEDANAFRRNAAMAIAKHNRLIKMAKSIDSTFNLLLLQQVMGLTFFLCMVGYTTLLNWDSRETASENILMLTFAAFSIGMTFLLFAYCYAGQRLIDESLYLFDALYSSNWYELEPADMKYFVMFLNQTRHPLIITGGGFYIYSLESFLAVIKSTMAYLSVLRTVI